MKKKILLVIIMALSGMLSYLFIYSGINTKNLLYIYYQVESDIDYKVNLLESNMYNGETTLDSNMYISSFVKDIDFNLNYKVLYDRNITGYYRYNTSAKLVIYEDDTEEVILNKVYDLGNQTYILNESDKKEINLDIDNTIDYYKYREEIINFISDNNLEASGYILLNYDIDMVLNFDKLEGIQEDKKNISVMIPVTLDIFKIKVVNKDDGINNYYDYSTKEDVNYLFIGLGIFFLILFIMAIILIIMNMKDMYSCERKYKRELNKILNSYKDVIINVKRIVNKKDYNLIYVDSFIELMDVYNKCNNPISYKEIKRNREAIFVLLENDNAWIYKLM